MKPLRSKLLKVLLCVSLALALTSCSKEVVKYVKQPLVLSTEVTDPVVVDEYKPDTELVGYTLYLLGLVEQMNIDRVSVRNSVEVHNGR